MIRAIVGKHIVLIDVEDAWVFDQYNLRVRKRVCNPSVGNNQDYYQVIAQKKGSRKSTALANVLLPVKHGYIIDHKNNDGLDNRKSNLRYATTAQNNRNRSKSETFKGKASSSKYIGVSWVKQRQCWSGQVWLNNKPAWQKLFKDEIEAAKARDKKAIELHGGFASLNFKRKKLIKRKENNG